MTRLLDTALDLAALAIVAVLWTAAWASFVVYNPAATDAPDFLIVSCFVIFALALRRLTDITPLVADSIEEGDADGE
jgi:cobalamin biosynthesis protein CobD/CbiB